MKVRDLLLSSSALIASVAVMATVNPTISAQSMTHTVAHGEYLALIASKYGVTVKNIIDWNQLTTNYLHSGQQLIVTDPGQKVATAPANSQSPTQEAQAEETHSTQTPSREISEPERTTQPRPTNTTPAPSQTQTVYYTVKPGDSLWLISNKHGLTINELKRLNGLTSNLIHPGNKLRVGKSQVARPSRPTQPSQPSQPAPSPQPKEKGESVNQPSPSQPQVSAKKYYTVQAGDYLWKIANDHKITVAQLKSWNNLSSNYIYAGNQLIVALGNSDSITRPTRPEPKEDKPEEEAPKPAPTRKPASYYTVKPGDSLWKISNQFGVTINQIRNWNRMASNMIHPGDRLIVSDGKPSDKENSSGTKPQTPGKDSSGSTLTGTHAAVQNVLNQYKNSNLAVFFESDDGNDSRTAQWNADSQAFYGASSTKLVLLGYVQDQIEKGIITWDTRFPYTAAIHRHPESYLTGPGGSGDIQYQPGYWNKSYSVRYLVQKVTSISDNLAADMLLHHVGYRNRADLNRFTQEAYGDSNYDRNISAREFTKLVKHIWKQKDPTVKQLLTHTQSDGTRLDAIPVKTHQKTGDYGGFHNTAGYVHGEKPFYLTILTRAWSDSAIGNLANQIYRAANR